ncbi:MAG: preprotein translocase subunit SecG [Candidatus Taylorbacteria bacterium]|nr:preprotein translocase subunit SecG [Candidatus Taylorbacteria bacterium]
MTSIGNILPYIQIALAVLLTAGILLQRSAAGIGGAFGDNWSSAFHTRRGFEKTLFIGTCVLGGFFAAAAFAALLVP